MDNTKKVDAKRLSLLTALLLMIIAFVCTPAYAWLHTEKKVVAYIPISTASSLFIGSGNKEDIKYMFSSGSAGYESIGDTFVPMAVVDDSLFDEIGAYLYSEGVDATPQENCKYYVFCISGEFVMNYKIQLAYTTNNQFTYEIFKATQSALDTQPVGTPSVPYTFKDGGVEHTYYYYIPIPVSGSPILQGSFLNQDTSVLTEEIAESSGGEHTSTYGTYNNVNKYAEPLYWQVNSTISGNAGGSFVHYYILRVNYGAKELDDKETDILCIAAKSFSRAS